MKQHQIQKCAALFIGIVLVLGNLCMIVPAQMTMGLFTGAPATIPHLEIHRARQNPASIEIVDYRAKRLVPQLRGSDWPIPPVQSYLDRRRLQHLLEIGRIAIFTQPEGEEEQLVGTWRAADCWRPDDATTIRFVVHNAIDGELGRTRVRAMIYADSPWGWGDGPDGRYRSPADFRNRPRSPGRFILLTAHAGPKKLDLDSCQLKRAE